MPPKKGKKEEEVAVEEVEEQEEVITIEDVPKEGYGNFKYLNGTVY